MTARAFITNGGGKILGLKNLWGFDRMDNGFTSSGLAETKMLSCDSFLFSKISKKGCLWDATTLFSTFTEVYIQCPPKVLEQ